MADFAGFTTAALDFYDDLEADNSKAYFIAHKAIYDEQVKAPMAALVAELQEEFGEAKLFRPHRDVRFAKDKSPYKTHQGAYVAHGPSTGWYAQIDASGFRVGAGFYAASSSALAHFRRSVDDETRGAALEQVIRKLTKQGWKVGGDVLKTTPRGYDSEHPRIELLRHRTLTVSKHFGFEPIIHSPTLLAEVRKDWRSARPLVEWVTTNATRQSDDGS